MKESSVGRSDAFEGLEWRHVLVMLSVLHESGYTKKEYIQKRYNELAFHFKKTLDFMACLGVINEREGHVHSSEFLQVDDKVEARTHLAERLFWSRNRYRTQIFKYIRKFRVEGGEPTYHPSAASRHVKSHVRNFLMEMGVVRHDMPRDCYLLAPEHLALYALAQESAKKQTPASVASADRAKEALGLAAEKAVVLYERDRVGSKFADSIDHVALRNAAAGYDVRSVTVDNDGAIVPRYIEVKAVSGSSLQFHWSRNEVLTAEHLAEWYYLYLVPVKRGSRLIIDEMIIIPNPQSAVLNAQKTWAVEPEGLRCRLREEMDGRSWSSKI